MKKTVLIVNDETAVREAVKQVLAETAADIFEAGNGREAIALALKKRPDLIILDVIMPGLDGYTTLGRLKDDERTAAIPVIIFTEMEGKVHRQIAEELGAVDFLSRSEGVAKIKEKVQMVWEAAGEDPENG